MRRARLNAGNRADRPDSSAHVVGANLRAAGNVPIPRRNQESRSDAAGGRGTVVIDLEEESDIRPGDRLPIGRSTNNTLRSALRSGVIVALTVSFALLGSG